MKQLRFLLPCALLPAAALLALVACGGNAAMKADDGASIVRIDPTRPGTIHTADFISSADYLILESTPGSMIRQVDRLCVMDSLLLVADYALRSVFIFDREGRYRSRISRVGRSREEYLSMNAVAFDTLHGEVLVHDIMAEKLLVYGLDGTCRGVTGGFGRNTGYECTAYVRDMHALASGNVICCETLHGSGTDNRDGLWEMTRQGEFVRWIRQFDFVHAAAGNDRKLTWMDGGRIAWCPIETNDDLAFDGDSLRRVVSYDVAGPTVRDYVGLPDPLFITAHPGTFFAIRLMTQIKGRFVFTYWIDEKFDTFYTLYDRERRSLTAGDPDCRLADGSEWLPTGYNKRHKPQFIPVDANLAGTIVVLVSPATLLDERLTPGGQATVRRLTAGLSEAQIENMNPVLQLLRLKR